MEEDEGGEGYDDEGFEEYSDEFDGDGDEDAVPSASASAVMTAPASRASARAAESRVVSPALKMRQTDQVAVAPDDKVVQRRLFQSPSSM